MWYTLGSTFRLIYTITCVMSLFACADNSDELKIEVLAKPDDCFQQAEDGDQVYIHYTGKLQTGQVFHSSREKNQPLPFVLGEGYVIAGWDMGIKGMCVGEQRRLVIPSRLAYGERGYPPVIAPNAVLTFELELMHMEKKPGPGPLEFFYKLINFLYVPVAVALVIYYMHSKYKGAPSKKDLKQEKKARKKRN